MFRTKMECVLCRGFSSTPRCYSCSSSPAGIALILAEAKITQLETRITKLEALKTSR